METNYIQEFTITVKNIPVTNITNLPKNTTDYKPFSLTGMTILENEFYDF